MTVPVTTLSSIVLLAHQQYGIRFQLTQQQLVDFVNMIQFIAYNQDFGAFENWDQTLLLGQDAFLETDSGSYTAPISTDIGNNVTGTTSGVVGKLINFITENRVNKWIVEPPDGGPNFTLTAGETLTIVAGSAATGVVAQGQSYLVSFGPYPILKAADGYPPFRKLRGITQLTDEQLFNLPPNTSFNGFDDYGILLNGLPDSRHRFYTIRYDILRKQVTLKSSTSLTIDQTTETFGPAGATINTSKLRWVYYINPPTVTDISEEANIILPEEYRYEILYKGISRLADTATYGDTGSVRDIINPLCERFWEDMRTQYQSYGDASDWISQGNLTMNKYYGYTLGRRRITQ